MTSTTLPSLDGRRPVDATTVAGFRTSGHAVVRGLADADEVGAYRSVIGDAVRRRSTETRPLAERDTYGRAFLQVPNLWRHDAGVAGFVLAHRFARAAADLLGVENVRIYHDQAPYKEPGGGSTPWHQDGVYWPLDTDLTITMWMPLVHVAPEAGGLEFAAGSHRERALTEHVISDDSDAHFTALLDRGRFPVVGTGAMGAGDASFHSGWALHRALPNSSAALREVMTVIHVTDGVRVAEPRSREQAHDLATWLPGHAPGDAVRGELHPRLPG